MTLLLGAGLALAMAGCAGDDGTAEVATTIATPTTTATTVPPTTVVPATVAPIPDPPQIVPATFEAGILPIVQSTCAQCHTGDGPGTQHLRFDTAANFAENADDIALVVGARAMPPWPASPESVPFHDDWSLTDEEITAIVEWSKQGAALDVVPETEIVPTFESINLADVDLEIVPEVGFDGTPATGDEYRCFIYDPDLTEPTWLAGFEFVPDQTEVVHHAIGYRIPADMRQRALEKDAAQTDGGGWTCFGGTGLGIDEIFLGWAPGQKATQFPDGSGLLLEPGEFLVVQVHYHFDIDAPEDRSSIRLDFADDAGLSEIHIETLLAPAEIPCTTDEEGPLCDRATALATKVADYGLRGAPADFILSFCGQSSADYANMTSGIATSSCDSRIQDPGQIISVLGHMHELGRSFRMTLNPDEADEQILLDIPDWTFDWQFNYNLAEEITVEQGDTIRIECSWDRSLRDPDLEPAYVLWADGTDDEMCFATVSTYESS
ncbi:MAG: cytochrome c [Acidimicrobiia bacterium]|nr:cytochrome c [Acidimicrobiia bacterium]